jgi:hypothetical protein
VKSSSRPLDEPYVAAQVAYEDSSWWIFLPYDVKFRFDFHSLSMMSGIVFMAMQRMEFPLF